MQYIYTRNQIIWYWKKWSKLTIQLNLASLSLFHFRINDLQKKYFSSFNIKQYTIIRSTALKKKQNKQLYWIIEIIICMKFANDVNIWSRCCRLANIYPLPVWIFFFFWNLELSLWLREQFFNSIIFWIYKSNLQYKIMHSYTAAIINIMSVHCTLNWTQKNFNEI